jgi:hypothetical protein
MRNAKKNEIREKLLKQKFSKRSKGGGKNGVTQMSRKCNANEPEVKR